MTLPGKRFSQQILRLCLCLGLTVALLDGAIKAQDTEPGKDGRGLEEFNNGVRNYIEIHRQAKATLGQTTSIKLTDSGQEIVEREHALAERITGLRATANEGEIFTPKAKAYFARALGSAYQSDAEAISASLTCVSELVERKMNPNDVYPENWGYNMMPPTILLQMPPLPRELEYMIVNRDMMIRDVEANLVVDVMRNAIAFPLEDAPCDE